MNIPELRDYQREAVDKVEALGAEPCVLTAPPGAGKTVMAAHLIARAQARGEKCAFLVDRVFLAQQAYEEFAKFGLHPAYHAESWERPGPGALVTTPQTQSHGRFSELKKMDLIIWDECHTNYSSFGKWFRNNDKRVVGLTATPMRRGMKEEFKDNIVVARTWVQLVGDDWLVEPRYFLPVEDALMDEANLHRQSGFD